MTDSRVGPGKMSGASRKSGNAEKEKKDGGMSKGQKNKHERSPNGQSWNN